jgi:thymidine phosphorylase
VESGYLKGLAASRLGNAGLKLGAGRRRKSDRIDPSVGLILEMRIGDKLQRGDTLAVIHAANEEDAQNAEREILRAIELSSDPVETPPDIAGWVE